MKKLLLLLLVLCMGVGTASAEGLTIYLNTGGSDLWDKDGASFAVWDHSANDNSGGWVKFTNITGYYYKATISVSTGGINLVRYTGENPSWENKNNQTNNITASSSNNYFTITGWNESDYTSNVIYENLILYGWHHITANYEEWKTSTTANVMQMNSTTGVNTLQVTGRALKAGTYNYKFVGDGSTWIPDGTGNDIELTIAEDGIYTITYSYNQFTQSNTTSVEKTSAATVTYKYYVYESENGITGKEWSNNLMTISGSTASLTVNNVALTKDRVTKFKIVEVVNDGTSDVHTYWSYSGTGDGLWTLSPKQSTTCDVTYTWDIPNTWRFTSSNVYATLTPLADSWYFIVNDNPEGSVWTIGGKLTETGASTNVFKGTITDWQGKLFALTQSSNITSAGGVSDWTQVVRPAQQSGNSEGHYWIGFYTYGQADTKTQKVDGNGYDRVWYHNIEQGGSIEFTFDATNKKWNADPYISRTITAAGYATFCLFQNEGTKAAIPTGVTAKYASSVSSGNITWTTLSTGIPYNEGVLLQAAPGTYNFTPAGSADEITGNLLQPITSTSKIAQVPETGYTNYILANGAEGVGFYKVNTAGSWCSAGTAYLKVADGDTNAPAFFLFNDSETTDLKAIDNGQLTIDNSVYDLQGRRVMNPTKGLYIVNGKKVIMK